MNILFTFGHELTIGGHFKSGIAFAEQLINSGHNVTFTVLGGEPKLFAQIERIGANVEQIFDYNYQKNGSFSLVSSFFKFYRTYSDIIKRNKIDIVHAQDSRKFLPLYLATCKNRKAFVYSHAGGVFYDYYPPTKCEFFVFSPELLNAYKSIPKYNKRKIHLISERISPFVYKSFDVDNSLIEKYLLPKDGITLFFSMRLHSHKKPFIDSLLAFSHIMGEKEINANIIVAGDGNLKEYFEMNAEAVQNESNKRIKFFFIGSIYSEIEIANLINYSTAVIGTGRGLMEAMACRKPIIILGENNNFELVQEKNISSVSFYNFSGRHLAFAENSQTKNINDIISIINSTEGLNKASQFSYEYFSNHLSSKIGVQKILSIYNDSLINKPSIIDGIFVIINRIIARK